tara:strand:- start:417 stop:1175 length:759 start_codon:yes stop_codon:yes gene_type:complete
MFRARVIPTLLLDDGGLVKTKNFRNPKYVGDPINAVKIFNEKEVDEIVFLDISKKRIKNGPNYKLLEDIASEAFMPFAYGGGISKIEQIKTIFKIGVEKIILNTSIIDNPELISQAVNLAGSSSIVVSVDLKRSWRGNIRVYKDSGNIKTNLNYKRHIQNIENLGAGELIINSIHCDGLMNGYDLDLIKSVSSIVSIPIIAVGGAGNLLNLREALDSGASAVGAGSIFVFHGVHKAVLINYPNEEELKEIII